MMQKYLFLVSLAALTFSSCSDQTIEFVGDATAKQAREIAFAPLARPTTRAAVLGESFPTSSDIIISAYDKTNSRVFFSNKTFKYQYVGGSNSGAGSTWGAQTDPVFWPLSATTINFLAYANKTGVSDVTWTNGAQQVVIPMADNVAQKDLMYAVGQGKVSQDGNTLSFPSSVNMVFKHTQALMQFFVKGTATAAGKMVIKNIIIDKAYFSGDLTINNSNNYNVETAPANPTSVSWSNIGDHRSQGLFNGNYTLTTTSCQLAQVMVIPQPSMDSFDSFTIGYELDGKYYRYTYTPANRTMTMATKYVYDITFDLHEIVISPSVTEWSDGGTTAVPIG